MQLALYIYIYIYIYIYKRSVPPGLGGLRAFGADDGRSEFRQNWKRLSASL